MSLDDIPRPRLAKLPRLKLGRDAAAAAPAAALAVLAGEAIASPLGLPGGEVIEGRLAFSASESRNSTKRFENDSSPAVLLGCSRVSLLFPTALDALPLLVVLLCSPAFSLSFAVQFNTLPMRDSISKRFESVLGALRN